MKNEDLFEILEKIRDKADAGIELLRRKSVEIVDKMQKEIDETIKINGKHKCLSCDGTGAVERLNSGYMRKFGLREWNGCLNCGGNGNDKRGFGFIDKKEEK